MITDYVAQSINHDAGSTTKSEPTLQNSFRNPHTIASLPYALTK